MRQDICAARVIKAHGTNDPFKICRNLGILVRLAPLLEMRGFFMYTEHTNVITVANDLNEITARFVCAHELKHCLGHRHLNRIFMDRRTNMVIDKYENEADSFAYHFVFPYCNADFEQVTMWDMADCLNVDLGQVVQRLDEIR